MGGVTQCYGGCFSVLWGWWAFLGAMGVGVGCFLVLQGQWEFLSATQGGGSSLLQGCLAFLSAMERGGVGGPECYICGGNFSVLQGVGWGCFSMLHVWGRGVLSSIRVVGISQCHKGCGHFSVLQGGGCFSVLQGGGHFSVLRVGGGLDVS